MLNKTAERDMKRHAARGGTREPPRIAVTGFGPFPGVPFNASGRLVEELGAMPRRGVPAPRLFTAALPTSWREGPLALRAFIREVRPHVIVHFGVSARARGFVIETRAFNEASPRPDCDGALPDGRCLRAGGGSVLAASLPARRIVQRLRMAGIPAELSADAGRYLCNAVLFESLTLASRAASKPRVGFIHIPALEAPDIPDAHRDGLTWASLRAGAAIIVDTLARECRAGAIHAAER